MAYIMATLNNVLVTGMFCYLAIHFEKWWIILFSIIGFIEVKRAKNKRGIDKNNDSV